MIGLFSGSRRKKPEREGTAPAPEVSRTNTVKWIDLSEMADTEARKWVEKNTTLPSPTPEELSHLKTRCDHLKKTLQSGSENPDMWTELGEIHIELQEYPEAQNALRRALTMDPTFETFDQINAQVRLAAKQRDPFDLATPTRKAMCHLGFLYERTGRHLLGEDYVLDAVYDCHDAQIQILAGKFYLESSSPEVDTAIAYFQRAIETDPDCVAQCDKLIDWFVATRKTLYPQSSWAMIAKYLKIWESSKRGEAGSQA